MAEYPEDLIEGSGIAGDAKTFSHRIIVDRIMLGTYIHCDCGALFGEQGLPALLVFLENHSR